MFLMPQKASHASKICRSQKLFRAAVAIVVGLAHIAGIVPIGIERRDGHFTI
jgi:hypothetical protein